MREGWANDQVLNHEIGHIREWEENLPPHSKYAHSYVTGDNCGYWVGKKVNVIDKKSL